MELSKVFVLLLEQRGITQPQELLDDLALAEEITVGMGEIQQRQLAERERHSDVCDQINKDMEQLQAKCKHWVVEDKVYYDDGCHTNYKECQICGRVIATEGSETDACPLG